MASLSLMIALRVWAIVSCYLSVLSELLVGVVAGVVVGYSLDFAQV